jgi:hypothetical protein
MVGIRDQLAHVYYNLEFILSLKEWLTNRILVI